MSDIRFCLNASTIRPTPLMDKVRIAGACGYAAIELWNNEIDEYLAAGGRLGELRSALDGEGLAVPTVIAAFGWLGSEGAAHDKALDDIRRRMEQGVAVGASHIIASPPMEATDLSNGGAQYRELLELGRQCGIRPAMEYLGFVQSVYTIRQALAIVDGAQHEDACAIMDPFHILRGGSPLEDIGLVAAEKVAIWHWNDVPADKPVKQQTDADRVMPGDGVGPLARIAQLALEQGYAGYVSLELFSPAWWERDPKETARIGLEKMRAFFDA